MGAGLPVYAGSILIFAWGIAHIVPTRMVVGGFEPLGRDQRLVLTTEWVAEGPALMFIGGLCALVTVVARTQAAGAPTAYRAWAGVLLVLATWTALTGGRTGVVQFKICPIVKSPVASMLLVGSVL